LLRSSAYVLANLVKNAAAPVVLPLARGRGSLGMDGDPAAVAATLGQLLSGMARVPLRLEDARIMELGSGRTPELALALAAGGAASVAGVDVIVQVPTGWGRRVGQARAVAGLAGLESSTFVGDEELARRVRFSRYDGQNLPASPASVDLVASKSVLEHVSPAQVEPLVRDMGRVLKPGGGAVHLIDLRDHMHIDGDEVHGDWLDALRYPEPLFRAMFSNRSTAINRLRANEWIELFRSCGLELVHLEPKRYPLPRGFDPGRVLERWSNLPAEELEVGQILLVARREPT
jgi:SAM-dependent methyltransferase